MLHPYLVENTALNAEKMPFARKKHILTLLTGLMISHRITS